MQVWILEEDRTFEQEVLGVYSSEQLAKQAKEVYEAQLQAKDGNWVLGSSIYFYPKQLDEMPVLSI